MKFYINARKWSIGYRFIVWFVLINKDFERVHVYNWQEMKSNNGISCLLIAELSVEIIYIKKH